MVCVFDSLGPTLISYVIIAALRRNVINVKNSTNVDGMG